MSTSASVGQLPEGAWQARRLVLVIGAATLGGAERVVVTLANAWAEQGREVWVVSSFLGASGAFYPLHQRVSMVYLADAIAGRPRWKWLAALHKLRALRRLVTRIKPDLVVSVLTNVNVLAITALARLKIPLIVSERTYPAAALGLPRSLQLARLVSYAFADSVVVQTVAAARRYTEILPGVSRISVIPNPLPGALMLPPARAPAAGNTNTVVAMGRLTPQKGYARLIRAFAQALGNDAAWQLQIWGEGPLGAELQGIIDALGMRERIRLCGTTRDPWGVLAAAQIFALSSEYEGFPNVMMEAMAIGLPCVAFDCPSGPRELSDEGRAAIIVPLNDVDQLARQMRQLAEDPDARQQLGTQAAQFVRAEFSAASILSRWDELFGEILERRAGTGMSGLLG